MSELFFTRPPLSAHLGRPVKDGRLAFLSGGVVGGGCVTSKVCKTTPDHFLGIIYIFLFVSLIPREPVSSSSSFFFLLYILVLPSRTPPFSAVDPFNSFLKGYISSSFLYLDSSRILIEIRAQNRTTNSDPVTNSPTLSVSRDLGSRS